MLTTAVMRMMMEADFKQSAKDAIKTEMTIISMRSMSRNEKSVMRSVDFSERKTSVIDEGSRLDSTRRKMRETLTETYQRRSPWDRPSRPLATSCLTSAFSIRLLVSVKASATKKTTICMISHCLPTAQQQASTRISIGKRDKALWPTS